MAYATATIIRTSAAGRPGVAQRGEVRWAIATRTAGLTPTVRAASWAR